MVNVTYVVNVFCKKKMIGFGPKELMTLDVRQIPIIIRGATSY
jgi:hypothetical protein